MGDLGQRRRRWDEGKAIVKCEMDRLRLKAPKGLTKYSSFSHGRPEEGVTCFRSLSLCSTRRLYS